MDPFQQVDLNNVLYFDKLPLSTKWLGKQLKTFHLVDSTQTVAKKMANGCPNGTIILSNQQEAGKGRLNRKWFSSSNEGLWMSILLKPRIESQVISQLTLLTAIAMVQALKDFDIKADIKWPNDCLVNGKKIAGILTEASVSGNKVEYIVIGIGLNLFQNKHNLPEEIQNIATSIKMSTDTFFTKFEVLDRILMRLEDLIELYLTEGFSPIRELWLQYTSSIGKLVFVDKGTEKEFGKIIGLSPEGYLLLENEEKITPILVGDVHFL